MSHECHREHAPESVGCAVVTVSDTRDEESDGSGRLIRDLLIGDGHRVVLYKIVGDDEGELKSAVAEALGLPEADALVINGGTGISGRDITPEVVASLLDKRLDGFGELFRTLSYREIGSAAIMSRALAGAAKDKIIICLPGSTNAVRLAMEKIVLPELGHMVYEVRKK